MHPLPEVHTQLESFFCGRKFYVLIINVSNVLHVYKPKEISEFLNVNKVEIIPFIGDHFTQSLNHRELLKKKRFTSGFV